MQPSSPTNSKLNWHRVTLTRTKNTSTQTFNRVDFIKQVHQDIGGNGGLTSSTRSQNCDLIKNTLSSSILLSMCDTCLKLSTNSISTKMSTTPIPHLFLLTIYLNSMTSNQSKLPQSTPPHVTLSAETQTVE